MNNTMILYKYFPPPTSTAVSHEKAGISSNDILKCDEGAFGEMMEGEEIFIDGKEATLKVRKYFEEAHGPLGVIAFEIEEAAYKEEKKVWRIVCKFYPSLAATNKMRYEVEVDAKNGKILGVKQLEPEK